MSWQKNLQNQNGGENYDLDCHTFQSFFSVIILFDSIPLHPSNHNPTNLWKEKSTMCFCYKTVVCNFCSGDDNVHEPICTKTIFYCKSHTHRHKHQDLVKKTHWFTIGRCDPDLSSHLQTLSLHSNTYTHTNAHWCNLTNSENAEQGTGHGETGTLWTKANRQTCLHFHFEFSGKFLTSNNLADVTQKDSYSTSASH